jgi:hypothetical protein
MIPGPPIIISCPQCGQYAKKRTLISGNTFGAKLWSDGKKIAPMLPDFPNLVVCSKCDQFYWVKDAKKIAEIKNSAELKEKYSNVEFIEFPTFHQYFKALETIPDEKYIRIRIWQSYNDYFRQGNEKDVTQDMQDLNAKNLLALLKLLGELNQNDLLMKAEILRNLGWFDESKQLPDRIIDVDLMQIKDKFLIEINKQNKQAFRLS